MIPTPTKPRVNPKEYRKPMTVTEWRKGTLSRYGVLVDTYYAKCPRCKGVMERDHVRFCLHCGQRLAWKVPLRKKSR